MHNVLKRLRCATIASALCLGTLAYADTVVIMAPGATVLSKDQVSAIYLGRNPNFTPFDLPEGTPLRDNFYKAATDRDASQVKAVWSRIVFTGKGQAPKELPDAAAVKKAVAADPKAIGYIDRAAVDASVKVVFAVE